MIANDLIGKYVIVRSVEAGVFAGTLESLDGLNVRLKNARRIWYWDGAASCSELAVNGTKKPENCKFPPEVSTVVLLNCKEILETSKEAEKSIKKVKEWVA